MTDDERNIYTLVGDAMFFLSDDVKPTKPEPIYQLVSEWLSSFNTDSATECFTAVQELKKRLEGDDDRN